MAVTYTTIARVASKLGQASTYFTDSSTPTETEVETMINEAEDSIDSNTGHAWRESTITDEYVEPSSVHRVGTGISFDLLHRKITELTKIEVWDGTEWVDWVATKTEGRDEDYWADMTNGTVYLLGLRRLSPRGVRVTYKFGESSVNKEIRLCATLMVASEIASSPEFESVRFTESGSVKPEYSAMVQRWDDKIKAILDNHAEFQGC